MSGIIEYLGIKLSRMIGKPLLPTKGLLRLATKDVFPDRAPNELSFPEFVRVINEGLRDRLKRLKIEDVDGIIERLTLDITENQSLIFMMLL